MRSIEEILRDAEESRLHVKKIDFVRVSLEVGKDILTVFSFIPIVGCEPIHYPISAIINAWFNCNRLSPFYSSQ